MTIPLDIIRKASDVKGEYTPTDEERKSLAPVAGSFKFSGDAVFHTIQGEGNWIGRPCTFVRLHFCNLSCTWCFAAGTKVLMEDGTEVSIEKIKVGDKVWSYKDKELTLSGVEAVYKNGVKPTVTVVTETGRKITCTPDHEFYVNKRKSRTGNLTRSFAKDLKGKYIKVFDGFPQYRSLKEEEYFGYLKGAYVGGGHYDGHRMFFQVIDRDFIEALHVISLHFGAFASITESSRKTSTGNTVYRLSYSTGAEVALGRLQTEDDLRGYVAGFFDAEGSLLRNALHFSQNDQNVLKRVKEIIESFGIAVRPIKCISGKKRNRQDNHTFLITGKENILKFYKVFPVQIRRKIYSDRRQTLVDEKVVDVVTDKEQEVFNVTTTVGNLLTNNILVVQCDAYYTWNAKTPEYYKEPTNCRVEDLHDRIRQAQLEKGIPAEEHLYQVVFTGGEPMMQQKLIAQFHALHPEYTIQIETNGTLKPLPELTDSKVKYNCSPKLASSGNRKSMAYKPEVLKILTTTHEPCFKFVFSKPEDIDEVLSEYPFIPREQIYMMPEGVTKEENQEKFLKCSAYIIQKGLNATPRLQNLMFDWAKRAV